VSNWETLLEWLTAEDAACRRLLQNQDSLLIDSDHNAGEWHGLRKVLEIMRRLEAGGEIRKSDSVIPQRSQPQPCAEPRRSEHVSWTRMHPSA
jgi:hypothetical protein